MPISRLQKRGVLIEKIKGQDAIVTRRKVNELISVRNMSIYENYIRIETTMIFLASDFFLGIGVL